MVKTVEALLPSEFNEKTLKDTENWPMICCQILLFVGSIFSQATPALVPTGLEGNNHLIY